MLIAYIDESGTNYHLENDGFFKDGPYVLWAAILIPQTKYFHTERMFHTLVSKLLGVKNWQANELHATNIWARTGIFKNISEIKIRIYFEELFQLLSKLSLNVVIGIQQKNKKLRSTKSRKDQINHSIFSFLHGIEYKLSSLNEVAILIADSEVDEKTSPKFTQLQTILFDRTKWRYNPGAPQSIKFKSKFAFETMSCFLLDQILYTNSKNSFFVQLADHICFVLNRVLTYSYLQVFKQQSHLPEKNKVPITPETFKFFCGRSNMSICDFDKSLKDVNLSDSDMIVNKIDINSYIDQNWIRMISPFK